MMRGIVHDHLMLKAVLAAAVTALAGCGGSSDSVSLSDAEKAALAGASTDVAVGVAENNTDNETSSSSTSTAGAYAPAATTNNCGVDGTEYIDNSPGYNIEGQNFPSNFTNDGTAMDPGSSDSNKAVRYDNCKDESTTTSGTITTVIDGGFDRMHRVVSTATSPDKQINLSRFGGYPTSGNDPDPLDFSNPYQVEITGDPTLILGIRGWLYDCQGCVQANLADFSSSFPDIDLAAATAMEVTLGNSSPLITIGVGAPGDTRSGSNFLKMTAVNGNPPTLTVNGPFSATYHNKPGCDFDASINTLQALQVQNFGTSTDNKTVGGEVKVTLGGDTYTVVYNSDGTATVNGQQVVDVQSARTSCAVQVSTSN